MPKQKLKPLDYAFAKMMQEKLGVKFVDSKGKPIEFETAEQKEHFADASKKIEHKGIDMEIVICPVCLQKFNMCMANEGNIYKAGYATMCPHCRHTIPKHIVREAQAELKRVMQK